MNKTTYEADIAADNGITKNLLAEVTKEIKQAQKLPAPDRLMGHYLHLLGVRENRKIDDMIYSLQMQPSYPAFESIAHCFSDWGYPSQIRTVDQKAFRAVKPFFLCCLTDPVDYVLVLKRDNDSITYIDSLGLLVRISVNELFRRQGLVIIETKVTSGSGKQIKPEKYSLVKPSDGFLDKLLAIFKVAFHRNEPITYKVFRPLSIFFTYFFYRLKFRPSMITFLWFSCVMGAAVILSYDVSFNSRLIAAGLIFMHYILDCCDGELARFTRKESHFGHILEQVVHWTTMFALIVGVTIGLFRETNDHRILVLGLLCMLFDALFHFVIYFINLWIKGSRDYSLYSKVSNLLNYLLPINPNIFFLGMIFNGLYYSLVGWTILSALLFILLVSSILYAEYKVLKRRAGIYRRYIKD